MRTLSVKLTFPCAHVILAAAACLVPHLANAVVVSFSGPARAVTVEERGYYDYAGPGTGYINFNISLDISHGNPPLGLESIIKAVVQYDVEVNTSDHYGSYWRSLYLPTEIESSRYIDEISVGLTPKYNRKGDITDVTGSMAVYGKDQGTVLELLGSGYFRGRGYYIAGPNFSFEFSGSGYLLDGEAFAPIPLPPTLLLYLSSVGALGYGAIRRLRRAAGAADATPVA